MPQHWGGDALFRDFEVYDSALGAVTFGASLLHRGRIQETTGNARARRFYEKLGFRALEVLGNSDDGAGTGGDFYMGRRHS